MKTNEKRECASACAFFRVDGGELTCSALEMLVCTKRRCSFFKTKAKLDAGREKAAKRIASLPLEEQMCYQAKYYGRKPKTENL